MPRSATFWWALASSATLWAAFPPLNLWPVAWVAPLGWLLLVRRESLPGKRPYVALWFAGFAYWMATLHWLRLPHPATSIGWVALSAYLGVYLPVFVGLSRVAVHQARISLVVAAPIVWTGLELAQTHLLTGFNMASVGHSQYRWISLIQVSDLAGAYAVTFLVMFVAACVARAWPLAGATRSWWPLAPAALAVAVSLAYGSFRLSGDHARPGLKVAIIQGSIDSTMKADPANNQLIHQQYTELSAQAVARHSDIGLIVWPETMFRAPIYTWSEDAHPPADDPRPWSPADLEPVIEFQRSLATDLAFRMRAPLLLGIDTYHFGPGAVDHYNSAVLVDRSGEIQGRYDKIHPVMFGEYVPFSKRWPWLMHLTPLGGNVEAGDGARSFPVGQVRVAPNICFESLLPHVVRGQVAELQARDEEPDILVNLTNDGWYWGSSELDLHLVCGLFRAVECRKPHLIAANTGFSAVIDADGRILQQGPRRDTRVLVADVAADDRDSPYVAYGDVPAGACLAFAVGMAVLGGWNRWGRRAAKSA